MSTAPSPETTPRASTTWLRWVLLPVGLGTWVPIAAGIRARRTGWVVLGAVIAVASVVGLVLPDARDGGMSDPAGVLFFGSWLTGVGWWVACRDTYALRAAALQSRVEQDVRIGLKQEERRRVHRLARTDPAAAVRRGVGRPDLPDSDHGWVVDVNHAPAGVLRTLPGVDEETARRIVATREEVGRFSSVDDLVFVLDLPTDHISRLRELAVALPA